VLKCFRNTFKEVLKMIEKTMRIGDLLELYPDKADLLLEAGMHCLGCPASQMETLEEACEVHGIDVDELVETLNADIKE
jgi:hydroxylamine reductase